MTNESRDLLIGGLGLVFTVIGYFSRSKTQKIMKSGVRVEGVVFSTERDIELGSQGSITSSVYPIIRFVTAEKEWVTQKYNITSFPRYEEGDKVTVIYNPENITEFILDDFSTKAVGYFFWLGILAIAIAAGLFAAQGA